MTDGGMKSLDRALDTQKITTIEDSQAKATAWTAELRGIRQSHLASNAVSVTPSTSTEEELDMKKSNRCSLTPSAAIDGHTGDLLAQGCIPLDMDMKRRQMLPPGMHEIYLMFQTGELQPQSPDTLKGSQPATPVTSSSGEKTVVKVKRKVSFDDKLTIFQSLESRERDKNMRYLPLSPTRLAPVFGEQEESTARGTVTNIEASDPEEFSESDRISQIIAKEEQWILENIYEDEDGSEGTAIINKEDAFNASLSHIESQSIDETIDDEEKWVAEYFESSEESNEVERRSLELVAETAKNWSLMQLVFEELDKKFATKNHQSESDIPSPPRRLQKSLISGAAVPDISNQERRKRNLSITESKLGDLKYPRRGSNDQNRTPNQLHAQTLGFSMYI